MAEIMEMMRIVSWHFISLVDLTMTIIKLIDSKEMSLKITSDFINIFCIIESGNKC